MNGLALIFLYGGDGGRAGVFLNAPRLPTPNDVNDYINSPLKKYMIGWTYRISGNTIPIELRKGDVITGAIVSDSYVVLNFYPYKY